MNSVEKTTSTIAMEEHGLKKYDMKVSTVVFMIFCLVAAGAYGIEEMVPAVGPGLTVVMLIVLPFVWGLPFGLVASELGSVRAMMDPEAICAFSHSSAAPLDWILPVTRSPLTREAGLYTVQRKVILGLLPCAKGK